MEEEENTELGTVLRQDMEADSVWDLVNRAGAVTTRPVDPGEKVFGKDWETVWRVSSPLDLCVIKKRESNNV